MIHPMQVKRLALWGLMAALLLCGCTPQRPPVTTTVTTTTQATLPPAKEPVPSQDDWKEDGVLKILTIGNSFSDDSMEYVYQIAKSAGVKKISLGNLYIGGCTLDTHAANAKGDSPAYEYRTNTAGKWSTKNNYKMSDAIKSQKWDYISLQQASGSSGVDRTYGKLEYLIDYVRELCPDAKIVWNMTWAYQQNSTHGEFPKYQSDQMKMYNAILAAVEKRVTPKEEIYAVLPTGTAIQNARTSYIGDHLTRDGYHLTYDFGRFVAGLTFVHKLTGLPIAEVDFLPDGVDEEMGKIAIEAATNAVKSPTKVTKSAYTDAPVFDESNYTKLELDWTALGYWNSEDGSNHHKIITGANNSKQFYASRMFTPEEIPVGSVIEVAEGWQYRPEAWRSTGVQSSRPGTTTVSRITVTASWWGDYTHRAFNLSKVGNPSLVGAEGEIAGALVIWIPKK